MRKWRKNGVKLIFETSKTLKNKGDVINYEIRNSWITKRRKKYII